MKNRVKKISPQTASCQVLDIKYIPRRSHVLKNWLPADRFSESDWSPVDYDLISKTILSGIQYNFIIGWLRKTRSRLLFEELHHWCFGGIYLEVCPLFVCLCSQLQRDEQICLAISSQA